MDLNVCDEERKIALKYCNEHLNGAWKKVSLDDIGVYKVRLALNNPPYIHMDIV